MTMSIADIKAQVAVTVEQAETACQRAVQTIAELEEAITQINVLAEGANSTEPSQAAQTWWSGIEKLTEANSLIHNGIRTVNDYHDSL